MRLQTNQLIDGLWNKYECTIQRANDVIRARQANGQLADAAVYTAASGRHGRHLESMMLYQNLTPSIDAYLHDEQSCQI